MIFFNQSMARIAGVSASDVLGLKVTTDFPPETIAHFLSFYRQAEEELKSVEYEAPVVTPEGRKTIQAGWLTPRIRAGKFDGMICTIRDITESKRMQASLSEREERFRSITEQLADMIFITDDRGIINYVSQASATVFGLAPEAMIGESFTRFLQSADVSRAMSSFGRAISTGVPTERLQLMMKHANGAEFTGELSGRHYEVEGSIGAIGVIRDISKQKLAQEALLASESRFRSRIESASIALYETDANGECLYVNDVWCKQAGMSCDDALGNGWLTGLHEDDRERIAARWAAHAHGGEPWSMEYRFRTPDGRITWVYGTATALRDERGQIVGYLGANADITERKNAESAMQRSEALLQEAQSISHVGHWVWDLHTNDTVWSSELFRIFGKDPAESPPSGRAWTEDVHPDDQTRVVQLLTEASRGGIRSFDTSYRLLVAATGEMKHVHMRGHGELDIHGQPSRLVGIVQDISDEKAIETHLRRAQSIAHMGSYSWNPQTDSAIWSNELKEIVGFPEAIPSFELMMSLIHTDDVERVSETERRAREEGLPFDIEYRIVRPDGEIRHVHDIAEIARDSNGQVISMLGTVLDITERRRAEDVRAAQLRLVEFAVDHSTTDILQQFLDEAEALTGSTIGFFHFLAEDQQSLSLQTWSTNTLKNMCTAVGAGTHYPVSQAGVWVDCVRERAPVIHNDYASLTHKKGLPKGHATMVRELVVPVLRGNRILAILGIGNKPTEYNEADTKVVQQLADLAWEAVVRRRAEDALKESEEKFRGLADSIEDTFFALDQTMTFTYANEACGTLFGILPDDLIGRAYSSVALDREHEWIGDIYEGIIRRGKSRRFEAQFKKDENQAIWYEIHAYPSDVGCSVLIKDITKRKRAEVELQHLTQRMRQLSARAMEASEEERKRIARELHDQVGQNITAFGIALGRIAAEAPPNAAKALKPLLDNAQQMLETTAEHVYGVMSELRPAVLDDYGIASAIRWYAREFADRNNIDVVVHGEDPHMRLGATVGIALYRAVQEALNNVAKHAVASHVTITVASTSQATHVSIADDGIGFDPDNRIQPGTEGGWGLLGIQERLELAGGCLHIIASPGHGTEIHMEVPRLPFECC
jgi:PAS domain S-box-containing protein